MQVSGPFSISGEELQEQIRRRAQASALHLPPSQAANLINGVAEEEREASSWEELEAADDRQRELQSRFAAYFDAAEAVEKSEAESDLPRFRAWRKEQLRVARETDGAAAASAAWVRIAGGILLAAVVLAKPFGLISGDAFFTAAVLAVGVILLGTQLLRKRRSPLWKGVFSDPKFAAFSVWHCASEAAAAALIREREPDAVQWEDALQILESRWNRRNRRSSLWAEEDYSGIRYTPA
ncbi:hypothetical protein GCM10009636_16880 [Arthrobacter koreensis]|jgi:hypothetical protein|uniref:hypothetical protein n=1 Tax=Arthrobacter TaxID=1663 RepID=UPI000ABB71E5|nr:hypothetical protein [Arthrobacter koreensis]MDF2498560.1 hypothetical protein [Arthrobacter koreensis]MEB7448043.1 hypothetical protein [Arthrobacter koreensis]